MAKLEYELKLGKLSLVSYLIAHNYLFDITHTWQLEEGCCIQSIPVLLSIVYNFSYQNHVTGMLSLSFGENGQH